MPAGSRTEVEAKFVVPDAATFDTLMALEGLGDYRFLSRGEQDVTDRYIDTPERNLFHDGYACRQRHTSTSSDLVVAVKGLGGARGAVHRRAEYEMTMAADAAPDAWPEGPGRDIVRNVVHDRPLVELFTLHQRRVVRDVTRHGRRVAIASLDHVWIGATGSEPVYELEIELTPFGTMADLRALRRLLQPYALRPQPLSKFERGLALVEGRDNGSMPKRPPSRRSPKRATKSDRGPDPSSSVTAARHAEAAAPLEDAARREVVPAAQEAPPVREPPPGRHASRLEAPRSTHEPTSVHEPAVVRQPPASQEARLVHTPPRVGRKGKKKSPGVRASDPMSEAGRKILRFHFERMIEKEPGTRAGIDPEELHDMRVATRRQRAALRIVGPHFRKKAIRPVRDGLRTLGGRLGAVRDLDVLIDLARNYQVQLQLPDGHAFQLLIDVWARRREAARAAMVQYLDGPDYVTFKENTGSFLDTPGAGMRRTEGQQIPRPMLVASVVPSEIWAHYGALSAFAPVLPWASVETLHALRIEGKRLRYVLEFFREALDPCADEAIAAIVVLQDHLGELQDAAVTIGLVRDFLASSDAVTHREAAAAAGRYLESRAARLEEMRHTIEKPWADVASDAFKSCLARAVAAM